MKTDVKQKKLILKHDKNLPNNFLKNIIDI